VGGGGGATPVRSPGAGRSGRGVVPYFIAM
jgi:hypothetical protein